MIILGLHCEHDSSAAIVKYGKIISDVAEEKFTRVKHWLFMEQLPTPSKGTTWFKKKKNYH